MISFSRAKHRAREGRRLSDQKYNQSAKRKARNKVYDASAKAKLRDSRNNFTRRAQGQTAHEAKYVVKILDLEETARRLDRKKQTNKEASRRFRARWGHLNANPVHRHRWEQIREGLWKEEEHPL